MKWFVGIVALVILASCMDTAMDVPTPEENLDGVYRVQATVRETNCSDVYRDRLVSYLITLNIRDGRCDVCGMVGTWNENTKTATVTSETSSLSITYQAKRSADERRPVFSGSYTRTDPSSGCSSRWTVVVRQLAYE